MSDESQQPPQEPSAPVAAEGHNLHDDPTPQQQLQVDPTEPSEVIGPSNADISASSKTISPAPLQCEPDFSHNDSNPPQDEPAPTDVKEESRDLPGPPISKHVSLSGLPPLPSEAPPQGLEIDDPNAFHNSNAALNREMEGHAQKVAQEIHDRIARECCLMKQRLANLGSAADATPSPLAYRVDYDSLAHRSEYMGYSIAGRHPLQIPETPAPNAYNASSYLGDGVPRWSVANKVIVVDDPLPGPCEYSPEPLLVRRAAPSFSMRNKTGPPLFYSKESFPGCNAYNPKPEVSHVAASLKGRQREFKSLKTPGPANYLIPSSLPSGPQFSMVSRGEYDPEDDPAFWDGKGPHQPPGPASYSPKADVVLSKSPRYSLGTRSKIPGPALDASPGPAYSPTLGTMERNDGPRVALKGRRHERIDTLPGPADYAVGQTPTVDDLVKVLHHRKLAAATMQKQMRASIKPAATTPIPPIPTTKSTPGPADYNTATSSRVKYRSAPSFSLRARAQLVTGGPVGTDHGPAPNAYAPPPNRPSKAVSFKGRLGEGVLVFPSLRLDTLRATV